MSMTLQELADRVGGKAVGDAGKVISACNTLEQAGPDDLSFLANVKYRSMLGETKAGAVVLGAADAEKAGDLNLIIADDPYFAFREAVVALHGFRQTPHSGVSEHAVISPDATVGEGCAIAPYVVIEKGATVGDRCVIYPHCYIGCDAVVGDDCVLHPNVTVYDGCVLGNRVTLHAGCSVGQDGFGYATHAGAHHKIPQIGNAVIGDDVEMGANCAIDRATVGSTYVRSGSKFSDLVTIGHGADIGEHNLLVAQVGIAGSTQTGKYVVMGGQVGVAGHLKIGNMVQLAAKAGVMTDIPDNTVAGGQPARPFNETKRIVLAAAKLPGMSSELKKLKKRIAELERQLGESKAED